MPGQEQILTLLGSSARYHDALVMCFGPLLLAAALHFVLYRRCEPWKRMECLAIYLCFHAATWAFVVVRVLLLPFKAPLAWLWHLPWRRRTRMHLGEWRGGEQAPLPPAESAALLEALEMWARRNGPGCSGDAGAPVCFSFSGCSWLMWYHLGVARAIQTNILSAVDPHYYTWQQQQQQDGGETPSAERTQEQQPPSTPPQAKRPSANGAPAAPANGNGKPKEGDDAAEEAAAGEGQERDGRRKEKMSSSSLLDVLQVVAKESEARALLNSTSGNSAPPQQSASAPGDPGESPLSSFMSSITAAAVRARAAVARASTMERSQTSSLEVTFAGSSCGALVACALAAGVDWGRFVAFAQTMTEFAGGRFAGPTAAMSHIVGKGLRELLPKGAHKRLTGRLRISMTVLTPAPVNVTVDRFASDEDVIRALLCACYLPVYYERPQTWGGRVAVDGGFSDNLPREAGAVPTVTVSPYPLEGGVIRPPLDRQAYPRWMALIPGNLDECRMLHDDGFADLMAWLRALPQAQASARGGAVRRVGSGLSLTSPTPPPGA